MKNLKIVNSIIVVFLALLIISCENYSDEDTDDTWINHEIEDDDNDQLMNKVATPYCSFESGDDVYVYLEIFCDTEDVTIYYSVNGSEPTTSSFVFIDQVCFSLQSKVIEIKAFAVKEGFANSDVVSAKYIREPYYAPTFNLSAGTYNEDIKITLDNKANDSTIYFTIDGSDPNETSPIFSEPIEIKGNGTILTIKARTIKSKTKISQVATSFYKIDYNYDSSEYMRNLTIDDYNAQIVGTWIGHVITPWTPAYNVEVTFYENGKYSARSLMPAISKAFYYGSDEDSDSKTYEIYDVYSNGKAKARIICYFWPGNTNTSSLDFIKFSNNFKNLSFEYWHRDEHGPVKFTLTKVENCDNSN